MENSLFTHYKTGRTLRKAALPLLQTYCFGCHGPEKQKGKLRLDTLSGDLLKKQDEIATWKTVLEQLEAGEMPPEEAKEHPKPEQVALVVRWLRTELQAAGEDLEGDKAHPIKGNYVDHDKLFNEPSKAAPATPARVWRRSPHAYLPSLDSLTSGVLILNLRGAGQEYSRRAVTMPIGLTTDPGFRDYAYRYKISDSETLQIASNATQVLKGMVSKDGCGNSVLRGRANWKPAPALAAIADAKAAPTADQVRAAVSDVFQEVIYREPTAEEMTRFTGFVTSGIERYGNRDGLVHGLTPVLLHPEAIFRPEFGQGAPDPYGRVLLSPTELAVALSYALTDLPPNATHHYTYGLDSYRGAGNITSQVLPDAALLAAARNGKLATRADVLREVTRMLDDPTIHKPRILRFFQEYFDSVASGC